MRKYLFIFKLSMMSALQYVINILINSIGYTMHIFIFFNLWNYIYSNPEELINGYSKSQMIWYVIVTEILWSALGGRKLCRNICDDVKGGNIAYNINKPYSYIGYVFSNHLGEVTIRLFIYTIIGMSLGIIFNGSFPNMNTISIMIIFISCILATIINTLFIISIGLISLIIEESYPFYWLYSKAILLLGTIFPVEFFSGIIQKVVTFSPIYVMCYGPARLFVGFNITEAGHILIAQLVYTIIAYSLCLFVYRKGVKKLNVNGG